MAISGDRGGVVSASPLGAWSLWPRRDMSDRWSVPTSSRLQPPARRRRPHGHSRLPPRPSRANVKVLVANGTQQPNTAAHFTQQLQQQGWNLGTPTNSSSPAAATTVYYGVFWQQSATQIATELGVPATAVKPLTPAVPVPNVTGYYVVVVIGSDLAGSGFPATTAPAGGASTTTTAAGATPTT